jgi:hypothetical protein
VLGQGGLKRYQQEICSMGEERFKEKNGMRNEFEQVNEEVNKAVNDEQ